MRRESGFTILEALCAFVILATVFVSLYGIGGSSYRILAATMDENRAALYAQSKLDELSTIDAPLPHVQDGTFEGSDVRWHMEARDLAPGKDEDARIELQVVTLDIRWAADSGSKSLTVVSRHLGVKQS